MTSNYEAWNINLRSCLELKSIEDKIRFLIRLAVLAPSSHNSQPWEFKQSGNALYARLASERLLPVSDPTGRQAYISLGCALENVYLGAIFCRLAMDPVELDGIVKLQFKDMSDNIVIDERLCNIDVPHLVGCIPLRATDRGKYSDVKPRNDVLTRLKKSAANYGVELSFLWGDQKDKAADIVVEAMGTAMANSEFRDELSRYVTSNITKSNVGMPGFSLGMSTPLSIIAPWMLKKFNLSKLSRKQDLELLKKYTPVFLIINTQDDSVMSWIRAGRFCQRVGLEATSAGLRTSVMAAAIEMGDYYKDLKNICNTKLRPQVFMRLGYSDNVVRHSPRLSAGDVTRGGG